MIMYFIYVYMYYNISYKKPVINSLEITLIVYLFLNIQTNKT